MDGNHFHDGSLLAVSAASRTRLRPPIADFGILGAAAIVVGLIVWALAPQISRLMEGVH